MKKPILKNVGSVIFFMLYTLPVLAEDEYPDSPDSSDDVPIDQWAVILFLAAVAIGFYYFRSRQIHMQK